MMRYGEFADAKSFLTHSLDHSLASKFHLRALRARAAIKSGDFATAKRDIDFVSSLAGREDVARQLSADLLLEQGMLDEAVAAMKSIQQWGPEVWRHYAKILEWKASKTPSLTERAELNKEIQEILEKYGTHSEFEPAF